ncbi:MAG: RNA pseudouridine synthase [Bacteroidetes bacterium GWC2_33_15]|nr:MAG: RNA pseudouridine synthase [Bacteroidetes bacterium GWA2_33_15]OFX51144.1 MAG: RNA pseudouridine synthase [Bacteroidetes bacterium GWC2_33_15]OFX66423.1 MAG: RNA pseudouridine synthase [Bacteroidetes bacterium GWB2_32_14]OFX70352.1 MAG: RNA pseudouridine synthase [Bacteroidetes bacterium GWD2_33_33]HAN17355.1 RNA pseudouridine synthase [Bacteroidales bacterium]
MYKPSNKSHPVKGKAKQTLLKVNEHGELLPFLITQLPGKSRNSIKALLTHRQITINLKIITQYNHPLEPGQEVLVNFTPVKEDNRFFGLRIVFEDPYLIVIEKKSGLLSIGTDKEREKTAYTILSDQVKKENPRNKIFVVHRLDRETSGLMMYAKSMDIQKKLQESWDETVLDRIYVALVEGSVEKNEGTITSWLKESVALKMHSSSYDNGGQKAITHYKVLKKNNYYSMLEVKLETGRKNQIRVHMQDIGHCIVGDKKYGSTQNPISRVGLHAKVLAFKHPVTNKVVRFETNIPKKFFSVFND